MAIPIGARFDHFEVIAPLGAGGMGEVYLARDTRLDRRVALKLLPAEFTANRDRVRRFEQEAKAASSLNHPNIITVYEIGESDGAHFIAAEYVDGQTLRQRMQSDHLKLPSALDVAVQIASALAAAHEAEIIHRDIKPENVMLRRDGIVKVLDFGLAKLTERRRGEVDYEAPTLAKVNTDPGTVMGTASYMSPEQARGLEVDARTDIFSLGIVLYEMLAGHAPFAGVNAIDVMGAILNQEPAPLRQHLSDAPVELQRIVSKALRKDREQRYQHIKDLLIDLKDLKQEIEFEAKLKGAQAFVVPPSGGSVQTRETPPEGGTTNAQPAEAATYGAAPARTTSSAKIIIGEIKRHKLGVGVALAILVAAVAGLAFGLYKLIGQNQSPSRASGPAPRVVPFTSYPGNECCPSFSPDGNSIAFAWNGEKGGNDDIWVKLIDAGAPLRLTTNPDEDTYPSWSPDGRYIAFVRNSKVGRRLFIVPALGGSERALCSIDSGTDAVLSWSPDGKLLAFSDRGSPQEPRSIFLLSVENLEKRKLTSPPAGISGDYYPAFSPDGKTLAFTRLVSNGVSDIYLVPAAGGEIKRRTYDNRAHDGLAWTPDGREIVFASNRAGNWRLWRIAVTGGTPEQLAVAGDNVFAPAIARQGNRLAYAQFKFDANIWRFETRGLSGQPSPPVRLIASTLRDLCPQYSADGKRIAFISDRSGSQEVWVCDSDGSNLSPVTSMGIPDTGSPRWSPDGRQIAFDSTVEGQPDIYVIGVDGGKPRRLTNEASLDQLPSWSRDGRWIYFASNRTGTWQVWKTPAEGGPAVQVTKQGGRTAFESPDGRFVYYTKGTGVTSLWRIPVAGGEEVQVLDQVRSLAWAVLDHGVYFFNPKATPQRRIDYFSFATGRTTQIAVSEKELSPWAKS